MQRAARGLVPVGLVSIVLAASFFAPVHLSHNFNGIFCGYTAPTPTVTGVSPNSGATAGGDTVTITGTQFCNGAVTVMFGSTPATTVVVVDNFKITAKSPAHAAATVDVIVTTAGGTSVTSPADRFTFGWVSLGGSLSSGPGPVSCAADAEMVFVLGGDGVPWRKIWDGTSWGPWQLVGGHVMNDPSAVCDAFGGPVVHLFTEGVDNHLYHRVSSGSGWLAWENLDGSLGSGPGSASCLSNSMTVYVLNTAGAVYSKTWTGSFGGWVLVGGHVQGDPAAVCEPGGAIQDLFVRGVDNALYHRKWNGSTWGAWENLGGSLTSGPAASSCSAGTVDVFVNGGDGVMWRKHWNGSVWGPWTSLGGNWTSDPGAVCQPGTTKIDVFARGANGALYWQELPN